MHILIYSSVLDSSVATLASQCDGVVHLCERKILEHYSGMDEVRVG